MAKLKSKQTFRATVRILALVLCITILALVLSGCSKKTTVEEIAQALSSAEIGDVGTIMYCLSAPEGSEGYLSDEMLLSLYGFDRALNGISDGAIIPSSFFHPCEFAVFVCTSTSTAEDVALHFNNRLKLLWENAATSAELCGMTVEEYREYIANAAVITSGRYIALIISSDTATAKRVFYRAI